MIIKRSLAFIIASAMMAQPVLAEDDPNAAVTAETARINAQTARINAEAALTTAKAAKDKAGIDALGLPKFENKTELVEKGGAIETAMLASRAVSRAAELISGEVAPQCKAGGSPVVVLGRDEAFDLNSAQTMMARMDYHSQILTQAMPQKTGTGGNKWFSLPLALNLISAAAGLFGNDVKVSAIELPEINDAMLANAVAGRLADCAILPSAGGGIADFEHSKVAQKLTALVKLRNEAAQALAGLPAKANAAQKARAQSLKTAIAEFDDFYKSINTPEADGKTALIRAILVERVALAQSPLLLRVAVTRSGGTITNAKNVKTFFGADPVRVSGGLIATYALVNATSGAVVAAGTTACQTAQAKLRNVQSGAWFTYDSNGKPIGRAEAVCH